MMHTLPSLPYAFDALEPVLDARTVEIHHTKHHQGYVNNLNNLIQGTPFENISLDEILMQSEGKIFNNAAQVWNHTFYWESMCSGGKNMSQDFAAKIDAEFGSFDAFKKNFADVALNTFGSGWTWFVKTATGELEIVSTSNAANPMQQSKTPLLVIDVWEHAYYLNYQNRRAEYIEKWFGLVDWMKVEARMK